MNAGDMIAGHMSAGAMLPDVIRVFEGSNGEETRQLYARLERIGPAGIIAMNLFRACKSSARAKVYRGGIRGQGSYRAMAYDRKHWSLKNLCDALTAHADELAIVWGWGIDDTQPMHRHVLYVEVATGQVSFHTGERLHGPDFPRAWDGVRGAAADRICRHIARLLAGEVST